MISLFERSESSATAPVDLMAQGRRAISLLEFYSCDAAPEPVAEVSAAQAPFVVDERAAQVAAMIEAARDAAACEMKALCESRLEARVTEERVRVETMLAEFAAEREQFFARTEHAAAQLALSIARKILSREVEADAMHLCATVRAALARVQDGSRPVLRVPAADEKAWRSLLGEEAEIVCETEMPAGECVLETRLGVVELGVRPQMEEVARIFDELLEREAA